MTGFDEDLAWLRALPEAELVAWLRRAVVAGEPAPLVVPHATSLAVHVAGLLRRADEPLDGRARAALPLLLREWGHFRPRAVEALERLLVVCAELRCATAEPEIVALARERLAALPDGAAAVRLRQRCLAVLAGFGPSERSRPLFESLLDERDYAPLCYRALYRADPRAAAREIAPLLAALPDEADDAALAPVLALAVETLANRDRLEFARALLQELAPTPLERVLGLLPLAVDPPPPDERPPGALTLRIVRGRRGGIATDEVIGRLPAEGLPLWCVQLLCARAERAVPAEFAAWAES
jgi:hypothetical protein